MMISSPPCPSRSQTPLQKPEENNSGKGDFLGQGRLLGFWIRTKTLGNIWKTIETYYINVWKYMGIYGIHQHKAVVLSKLDFRLIVRSRKRNEILTINNSPTDWTRIRRSQKWRYLTYVSICTVHASTLRSNSHRKYANGRYTVPSFGYHGRSRATALWGWGVVATCVSLH